MKYRNLLYLSFIFLLAACAKPITRFPSNQIIPRSPQHHIAINNQGSPVKMLYMGCGHLIIEYNGEMIVTDPYFSIQPFSLTKKIKTNQADFEKYKAALTQHSVDLTKVKSIWLAHTHYDHMMDIPFLLKEKLLTKNATIYGNDFGDDILQHFITPAQYHPLLAKEVVNPMAKNTIHWFDSTSSIRVLPIVSDHAPHMKILGINIHLMKGKINNKYFRDHLTTTDAKTNKNQWREGTVYSFLVDFVRGSKIDYRMFIQTSASHYPLGQPPKQLLEEKAVDVAVLCLASSNYVKPYPIELLNYLAPKKVVFIHWEDFFTSSDFNKNKLVRFTNFKKLDKRFRNANLPLDSHNYVMPQPGTMILID
jgi:hypothetical protein